MPNSAYEDTNRLLEIIVRLSPSTILDVGAGFGRWGFLCRCHLAGGENLQAKPDQRLRIDAVEIHRPNISALYAAVYNQVYEGDARQVIPSLGGYDLIICSNMLEHLEKQDGWTLLRQMHEKARMALLLSLPLNDALRGAVDGNTHEAHRSVWHARDFRGEPAYLWSIPFAGATKLGVVVYPKTKEALWVIKTIRQPLRRLIWRVRQRSRGCAGA